MKIRTGFVSNSSSSSFVVVYKVNVTDELKKYMAEEFGKYGTKLLKDYVADKKETLEDWVSDYRIPKNWEERLTGKVKEKNEEGEWDDDDDYHLTSVVSKLKEGEHYLTIDRVYNSNDWEDMNRSDSWLADHIPAEFKEVVYEEEPE